MAVTTSASARVCAWVTPGSASRAIAQAEIQKVGVFAFIGAPFVSDERTSGHRALPVGNRPMHDLRSSPRIGISSLYSALNFSFERACLDRLEFRLKPRRSYSNSKAGPGFQS